MFYSDTILSQKGPLANIWLAAHWDRKLSRGQVIGTDISASVAQLLGTKLPEMALRLKGQLLLGIVKIYGKKTKFLLDECTEAYTHMVVLALTRPGTAKGGANTMDPASIRYAAVTLVPQGADAFDDGTLDMQDVSFPLADAYLSEDVARRHTSLARDITLSVPPASPYKAAQTQRGASGMATQLFPFDASEWPEWHITYEALSQDVLPPLLEGSGAPKRARMDAIEDEDIEVPRLDTTLLQQDIEMARRDPVPMTEHTFADATLHPMDGVDLKHSMAVLSSPVSQRSQSSSFAHLDSVSFQVPGADDGTALFDDDAMPVDVSQYGAAAPFDMSLAPIPMTPSVMHARQTMLFDSPLRMAATIAHPTARRAPAKHGASDGAIKRRLERDAETELPGTWLQAQLQDASRVTVSVRACACAPNRTHRHDGMLCRRPS